jgi:peptidoglycan/LPS O-acetylase OafA/YrhL
MAVLTFLFMSYLWRPRMRALAYCGVISYSIYLFHSIVFELARQMAESGAMPIATAGPLVVVTALLAATILLSSLTYAAIERPAIDAGRWLARALRQRAERLGT